jgi:hypothetical protein
MYLQSLFIFFNFLLSHLSSQITRKRGEREKTNKERKNLWHIEIWMMTSPVSLKKSLLPSECSCGSQTVNAVGHTSSQKVSRLACLWSVRVAHSGHSWWLFSVSLYLSRQIFSTVLVVSSLEFWCVTQIFFFSLSLLIK